MRIRNDKNIIKDKELNINFFTKENDIEIDDLYKQKNMLRTIETKNIYRSKFGCQRLAKANENELKTFITLTYAENITDIAQANKLFQNWCKKIKIYISRDNKKNNLNKELKYICVPEFQKRGAVHYHLITNLDIKKDVDIIPLQKGKKSCYDVKYWNLGYSSVQSIETINVVGYLLKYMTKDIDNRLFVRL